MDVVMTPAPNRVLLTGRALELYAQTVCSIVGSTAPAGSYTLAVEVVRFNRYSGGRGRSEALRSVVGSDVDIRGRFTAHGPVSLPPLDAGPAEE